MQRLRNFLAITSVRLSIAYTLIFGFVAVLIVFYMTGATANFFRRQIKASIDQEVVQIARIYEAGGASGVIRRIERYASGPGANLYVVADQNGEIIAGNVRDIAPRIIGQTGWTERPFPYSRYGADQDRQHVAIARIVEMPNGMRLLIGRDLGEPERFRVVVSRALAFSMLSMLLVGLLTWVLIGRQALRRVNMVSRSTDRILAGDRSERLPVIGSGDEFDRLSTSLNAMLDRINLLDEGLRQVSDNIAHDLKTPLTRLRNKADSALHNGGGETQAALQEIIADTDQIIRTFNALLMISRVESGSVAAELSRQDLSAIVEDVAELYMPVAEDEGFAFESDVEPGIAVHGNRELISQALSNLIDNAIKHGRPEEGEPRIFVRLQAKDGLARIEISDTGTGIAPEDHKRVTERFTRLERSRSKPGNGLGLSLVRAVAQMHSGLLEFQSNEPGLKALLILPVDRAEKGDQK
jgi:signal transduction histidine kinase